MNDLGCLIRETIQCTICMIWFYGVFRHRLPGQWGAGDGGRECRDPGGDSEALGHDEGDAIVCGEWCPKG